VDKVHLQDRNQKEVSTMYEKGFQSEVKQVD